MFMSLGVMFPKMSAHRRDFDETKIISLLVKDNELLEKYNEIWDKSCSTVEKGFYNEPVYNKKY